MLAVPDVRPDLNLPMQLLQPGCDVAADDAVLDLHIGSKRLAGEQGQEGFADGLVLGAMHEGQILLAQNVLSGGVQGHEQRALPIHTQHLPAELRIGHKDHELPKDAVPGEAWEGVPATHGKNHDSNSSSNPMLQVQDVVQFGVPSGTEGSCE